MGNEIVEVIFYQYSVPSYFTYFGRIYFSIYGLIACWNFKSANCLLVVRGLFFHGQETRMEFPLQDMVSDPKINSLRLYKHTRISRKMQDSVKLAAFVAQT